MRDRSWDFISVMCFFILLLWVVVTVYDSARANYLQPAKQKVERNEFGQRLEAAERQREILREW